MEELKNKKPIRLLALRIIAITIMIIVTTLMAWWLIDVLMSDDGKGIGFIFFVIYGFVFGGIALSVSLLLSLVGLIISIVNKVKRDGKISAIVIQAILTVLPIAIWFGFVLIVKLI